MQQFTDEQLNRILKEFYALDIRMGELSDSLFKETLNKMLKQSTLKPLERWVRMWKTCRLNIRKTFHRYGLNTYNAKKDIHSLFTLYLDDKKIAKILRESPQHLQQTIIDAMGKRVFKINISSPSRGFAERIAHRLEIGLNITLKKQKTKN
ncbi:MAG: hypothetical protein IKY98_03355 [Alphaproteobacteria bacterium]|nr:hypothetical protein [Alphaproteobacteria bacterium]